MRRLFLLALLMLCCGAKAAPGDLQFEQRPGAELPLQLALRDEAGSPVRLGDYFGREPVVLVLGYFDCPNLCSTVLDGVIESLGRAGVASSTFRLLAVSIDPREGPAAARRRLAGYRPLLAGMEAHFLTGGDAARLAADLGFPYAWDGEHAQYLHPAGFVLATPQGRVSRYFPGVRFDTAQLRRALADAAAGHIGGVADRLLLLCSHYDPRAGRYSADVMTALRGLCLLVAGALGYWIWRRAGRTP